MIRNSLCSLMIVAIASAAAFSDDTAPKVKIRKLAKPVAEAAKPKVKAIPRVKVKPKVKVVAAGGAAAVIGRGVGASRTAGVRKEVDVKDNVEQFLLLLPGGPVLVEARLTLDGQPFRTGREKLVDELLKQADTDGDGKSTWEEAAKNVRFGNGRFYQYRTDQQRQGMIARLDLNKDKLVDRYEARAILATYGNGPAFRMGANNYRYSYGYGFGTTQPDVKKLLDADGDGVLSAKELAAAEERLKSRDADDNDLLEARELGGNPYNRNRKLLVNQRGRRVMPVSASHLLGPAADLVSIYNSLQKKYAGEDGKLTAKNFPRQPKLVETLDLDKNGELDSGEVIGFHLLKPSLILEVSLGKGDRPQGIVVKKVRKPFKKKDIALDKSSAQVAVSLPGLKLRFSAPAGTRRTANYGQYAKSMMTRYDADKNGYVDKKEWEKVSNNAAFRQQFARWDINADDKIYADEIEKSYEQLQLPMMTQLTATVAEQPPSVFAALDVTGDNRISLREMRTAGERLTSFDKNKDGKIDLNEMPSEMTVTFGRGGSYYNQYRVITAAGRVGGRQPVAAPKRGPKWFISMDRNGDGDVTLKEFLGTKEQFQKLDTNGDGFLELKEAEAVKREPVKSEEK